MVPNRISLTRNPSIALALIVLAGGASAQIEESEDGHLRVLVLEAWRGSGGVAHAGAPFPAAADWEANLRRQVGGLQIADMNGDGRNDLVVGCFHSNSQPPYDDWHDMIYFNTGSELEASPSWVSSDEIHTGDLSIGDINGDTYLDVFAISGGSGFSPPRVYFGGPGGPSTSPGWLATPPVSGWATSGLLFDADNDGDLDAITTNQGVSPNPYRPMYFFRNSLAQGGAGLETTPSWQSAEASIQNGLDAADFDGDGFLDIGVAKWVNFESAVYRSNAGTLETTPIWTTGDDGTDKGAAWADFDGNGWPDLLIGHDEPTRMYENEAGVLTLAWESDAPFYGQQEVKAADVDGDGDLDAAEVNFSDGRTHVYLNENGSLSIQPSWTYDASTVANAIAFGDINGDGRMDLAIGFSGDISIRVFYGLLPECLADIDGDGDADGDDFFGFLDRFAGGDDRADLDGDGDRDADDFFLYLDFFAQGC